MQSVLFVELTDVEEANLSGGKNVIKIKSIVKGGKVKIGAGDDVDVSGNVSADASSAIYANIYDY
ncbi:hypothetical protein [Nostoc sp.]|uniref:hypothetical protein n=1 Tax=Nostoc sp. TaxID=1180 RepID=UPI002FF94AF4